MKLGQYKLLGLFLFSTIFLNGCIGSSGPTDEKAIYDANNECEKMSNGLFTCETEVISSKSISRDLSEIVIGSAMVRTQKEVPQKLLAMAMMNGDKQKNALYRVKPGTKLKGRINKKQTYVNKNNTWVLDKSEIMSSQ